MTVDTSAYNGSQGPHPIGSTVAARDFTALTGVKVSPYLWPVLACDECGCIFAPDTDGARYYPDRHVITAEADPSGTNGCRTGDAECQCHQIPYSIDLMEDNDQ